MIVQQIVYYNEADKKVMNNPISLTANDLIRGLILNDTTYDEIQVKAYPGTMLEINGQNVVIGDIGIYNILYPEKMEIISVKVDSASVEKIINDDNAFLVITAMRND